MVPINDEVERSRREALEAIYARGVLYGDVENIDNTMVLKESSQVISYGL